MIIIGVKHLIFFTRSLQFFERIPVSRSFTVSVSDLDPTGYFLGRKLVLFITKLYIH